MMPATQGMLMYVRDELVERIATTEERVTQQLIDVKTGLQRAEENIKLSESAVRSEIREKTSEIRGDFFRVMALTEEQRAQNNIVVEATHGVIQRQERLERRQDEITNEQREEHARIFAELHAHEVRFDRIEAAVLQQGADLLVLRQGQTELKADVTELQRGQAELQRGQAELQRGQAELQRGQAKLEADVATLQRGQAKLEANVAELQRGQQEIVENVREILALLKGRAGV